MFKKLLYILPYSCMSLCIMYFCANVYAWMRYEEPSTLLFTLPAIAVFLGLFSLTQRHPALETKNELKKFFPLVSRLPKYISIAFGVVYIALFSATMYVWFYPQSLYAEKLPLAENVLRYGYYISKKILAPLYALPGGYSAVFWITAESTQHNSYDVLTPLTEFALSLTIYKILFWVFLLLSGVFMMFVHRCLLYRKFDKEVRR